MAEPKRYAIPQLRAWRLHRLLTHRELAEKAGVGKQTIMRLEREGQRANELTIHKLARALDVSFDELLEDKPPAKKQPAA